MNILFIVPYPHGKAPSQRFRYEQYLEFLKDKKWHYTLAPFLDNNTWSILYKPGFVSQKVFGIILGFLKRFILLFSVYKYDYVFIHREATPIGPPWFEWLVSKVLRKKIIYDFDDAIWIPNTSATNKIVAHIKWHSKVASICKWAFKVSCGNAYLQEFACQFNPNVTLNPTTIDTEHLHNLNLFTPLTKTNSKPIIGWTGTHSTLQYLEPLVLIIQKLEQQHSFEFCIIANKSPDWNIKSLNFVQWNKETEIQDLARFDIGLMPLTDDKWAKGKCGFKALQYMALEIPAIVSQIGVNTEIVDDGKNGFVCSNISEWENAISLLLKDHARRENMGKEARGKIIREFSVVGNTENFISLFK